jgi:hypothetical protein
MSGQPTNERGLKGWVVALGGGVGLAALIAVLVPLIRDNPPPPSTTQTTRKPSISVTCSGPSNLRPGQRITLVYEIDATEPMTVGLGAGFRDDAGDHATGDGDRDSVEIPAGRSTQSRPFTVPNVPAGQYELIAEIWPRNEIGREGVETLAEHTCADVSIA